MVTPVKASFNNFLSVMLQHHSLAEPAPLADSEETKKRKQSLAEASVFSFKIYSVYHFDSSIRFFWLLDFTDPVVMKLYLHKIISVNDIFDQA